MSDQELPLTPTRRSSPTLWIVIALVIVVAAAGVYFLVVRRAAIDVAAYLPVDSVMAVTMDFTKSTEKEAALKVIEDIIKDAGVEDPRKWMLDRINKELKLDFEKDVLTHLSGKFGGAMLPQTAGGGPRNMEPTVVFVAGTRSKKDADALMGIAVKKMKEHAAKSEKRSYEGFSYYALPEERANPCVGAVKGALVFASNEIGFKRVVDTVRGQPNLTQDPNFVALKKTGPGTFASFFFSGANYYKFLKPVMTGSQQMPKGVMNAFKDMAENAVAMVGSADASAEGIVLTAEGITKKPTTGYRQVKLAQLASMAPKNAALVASRVSVDKAWADFKNQLFADKELRGQIEGSLAVAKQAIGFDPMADFLDRITECCVYYIPRPPAQGSEFPGDVTIVLKTDKPMVVGATVGKIKNAISGNVGPALSEANIAGRKVYLSPDFNGMRIAFGMVGDGLVVAFSGSDVKAAMATAVDLARGKTGTMASSDAFKSVQSYLPETATMLVLVDSASAAGLIAEKLDPDDRKVAEAIMKRLGTFAMTGSAEGTKAHAKAVVPFKK
ncbi:MAG: hypothetical protein A2Z18_03060 [Armatimonadetes bacterium RBG_16_58_9]|nr:MAG: hypothetical protein A2Z18_03060 [Armatimonadetes bacterium RBG_16_58_9]